MAIITAQRVIDLKALLKAECQRRKYTGSVASYGGTAYDFTQAPAAGKQVLQEHYEKLAVPLNAISGGRDTGGSRVASESELAAMEAEVKRLKAISATASNAGCAASCTGLCQGGCASGCSGCGSSCSNDCYGDCEGGCSGNCGFACVGACTNACSGCGSVCSNACTGGCDVYCANSCQATCSTECVNSCVFRCQNICEGGASAGRV